MAASLDSLYLGAGGGGHMWVGGWVLLLLLLLGASVVNTSPPSSSAEHSATLISCQLEGWEGRAGSGCTAEGISSQVQ